jgi:hypothetical protein
LIDTAYPHKKSRPAHQPGGIFLCPSIHLVGVNGVYFFAPYSPIKKNLKKYIKKFAKYFPVCYFCKAIKTSIHPGTRPHKVGGRRGVF